MRALFVVGLLTSLVSPLGAQTREQQTPRGLRIVVLSGEDAVNVIQQKTAVAPVIEIRDRNDLPVSGIAVTFSVSGQSASFGSLSTLTVTTNAAGQAAAVGLTPTAAGAVQINATALVQGQALTATITQTNVLTAAQAAGAASAGASTSGGSTGAASGSAGAAGGGGLSGVTIGIVGAAVGAGALVATQIGSVDEPPSNSIYSGTFTGGPLIEVATNADGRPSSLNCTRTFAVTGGMDITLDSTGSGIAGVIVTITQTGFTAGCTTFDNGNLPVLRYEFGNMSLTGAPSAITFSKTIFNSSRVDFTGSLIGSNISGTLLFSQFPDSGSSGLAGSTTISVTLQRYGQ